jgi:hypothetical protein
MNKNDLIIITSHSDSDEKLNLLRNSISEFVKQDRKILLSSHIGVPDDILEMVDFFIYDRDNPMITKEEKPPMKYFINYGVYEQDFFFNTSHTYAALKLVLNGVSFAISNGFRNGHLVVYDNIIYDKKVIDDSIEILNDYDMIIYKMRNDVRSNIFSFRCIEFYDQLKHLDSKESYLKEDILNFEELLERISGKLNTYFIDIETIKSNNFIDGFCANGLHEHILRMSNDDKKTFLFLSKENNNNQIYLFLLTWHDNLNFSIIVNDENHEKYHLKIGRTEIRLIELPEYDKLTIFIEEYGTTHIFDKKTQVCSCNINDRNIISNIKDLKKIEI